MCRLWPVILLLLPYGAGYSAPKDEIAFALDSYVKKSVKQSIPGASLAVIIDGNIRLLRGYGGNESRRGKEDQFGDGFSLSIDIKNICLGSDINIGLKRTY